jgi:hypothetical protein
VDDLREWLRYILVAVIGLILGLFFIHNFMFFNSTSLFASTTVRPAYLDAGPQAGRVPSAQFASPAVAAADGCQNAGMLYRSLFTTGVTDREPDDHLEELAMGTSKVFFYTEVIGAKDEQVTHVWYNGGKEVARVPFDVKGDRWRTWSSKNIDGSGQWTVKVVDNAGCVLGTQSIDVANTAVIDPKDYSGWVGPRAAFMNFLATRLAKEKGAPNLKQTQLESAIQAHDMQTIQQLLDIDNLFVRDQDGLMALDFTHRLARTDPDDYKSIEDQLRGIIAQNRPNTKNDVEMQDFSQIAEQIGPTLDRNGDSLLTAAIRYNDPEVVSMLIDFMDSVVGSHYMLFSWDQSGKNMSQLAHDLDHETIATYIDAAMAANAPPWAVGSMSTTFQGVDCDPKTCVGTPVTPNSDISVSAILVGMAGHAITLTAQQQNNDGNNDQKKVNLLTIHVMDDVQKISISFPVSGLGTGEWQFGFEDTQSHVVLPLSDDCGFKVADPAVDKGPVKTVTWTCMQAADDVATLAAEDAPVRLIKGLLQTGVKLGHNDNAGAIASGRIITSAVQTGNIALVRYLLGQGVPIDEPLEAGNGDPKSALVIAVEAGNWGMAHYLISKGANVNYSVGYSKETPLHYAVKADSADIARDLIKAGARLEAIDESGQTPLYEAASLCEGDMVKLLLQAGANPNYTNTVREAITPQTPHGLGMLGETGDCPDTSVHKLLETAIQSSLANQASIPKNTQGSSN